MCKYFWHGGGLHNRYELSSDPLFPITNNTIIKLAFTRSTFLICWWVVILRPTQNPPNQSLPKINNSIPLPTAQIFYFGVLGSITLEKRKPFMTKQLPNGFHVWMA
jgi:hypothetical protein